MEHFAFGTSQLHFLIDTFKKSLKTYLFEIAHDITTD